MSDIPNGLGIVVRVGWETNGEGKDVFRAIVEFPNGAPEGLTLRTVWNERPVEIREVETT